MLQIIIDNEGWVTDYVYGDSDILVDYIIVEEPSNIQQFIENYDMYKYQDRVLIFHEDKISRNYIEKQKRKIRHRRETECFSIIDRSQLWYNSLSEQQLLELNEWYQGWLVAPDTFVIPRKPDWL